MAGDNVIEDCVFEVSSGFGRGKKTCVCAYKGGELYASPKIIGMTDMAAMMCMGYDGLSCLMTESGLVSPVSWMMKEKPDLADDLEKFCEMAERSLPPAPSAEEVLPVGVVVYAISDGHEHHKVGVASNVQKRMKSLQTGCPRQLILSSYVECYDQHEAYRIESAAKKALADKQAVGEWFQINSYEAVQALHEAVHSCGLLHTPRLIRVVIDNPPGGLA
jgi:hypothetical protein